MLLILHIGGGGVGLVSGAAAAVFRKGGRLHRLAGNVFFVSMLTMTGVAAAVAPFTSEPFNTVAGLFTFYLVVTGWATVRRKPGSVGRFEAIAPSIGLSAMAGAVIFGVTYSSIAIPALAVLVITGLAVTMDARIILGGGISGAKRLARHLWRMGAALFIASTSFFIGQQRIMPPAMHGAPILFVPAFAPLGLMLYWLIRVRSKGEVEKNDGAVALRRREPSC